MKNKIKAFVLEYKVAIVVGCSLLTILLIAIGDKV